ncbi:MAG: Spy/CpxP family protein refolding chaperone [Acidobacteria bacterium]|jgi:Spy/CpxP family protein refolding chaperone|nr:Spy/CpxP family protein refolding chaperone [Acidobacteriota bacterium]
MLQKLVTVVGIGALVGLGASRATAQPFGPGRGDHGPRGFRGPAGVLDLTEEQQAGARDIFERQRPEMEALREQMRENRKALRDSLESGGADPCVVGEIVLEGHALQEKGRALRERSREAFAGLLNAEQKKSLETLEAARALVGPNGRGDMMGPRGDGWGPPGGGPDWE